MPLALPDVSLTQPVRRQREVGREHLLAQLLEHASDLLVLEVEQLRQPPPAAGVIAEVQHEVVRAAREPSHSSMNASIPASGRKWK